MVKQNLTQSQLKERLHYDPEIGLFTWIKIVPCRTKVGDIAGHKGACGYSRILVAGIPYYAHRLAWFYVTGQHPVNEIDHINGDKSDNRFCNLREANRSQNKSNTKARGWTYRSRGIRHYESSIKVDGKSIHLGVFATKEEARKAYAEAAHKYRGEFAHVSTHS